jgi:hypothetical protein
LSDEIVDVKPGDAILVIGEPERLPKSQSILTRLQALGANVYFYIHALPFNWELTDQRCEQAETQWDAVYSFADGLVCASAEMAEELRRLLERHDLQRAAPVKIGVFDETMGTQTALPAGKLPWCWTSKFAYVADPA